MTAVVAWETVALAETVPPPASLEEQRLVAQLRRGEASAFEELYRKKVGLLYGLAYRLTCRKTDAEELTQEAFVRAWEHRDTFQNVEHFVRWLKRVLVNCWINNLRKRKTGDEWRIEDELDPDSPALAAPPAPAGLKLDLERALEALSPRLRAVVVLYDVHGSSHDEIAELLEMTPGASKVQLHRARTRLREMLR